MTKDDLKRVLRDIGLLGILVGFILSTALHPFFASTVAHFYAYIGAPGYQSPNVDIEYNQVEAPYPTNETIPHLGNITWKEEYEIYRVNAKNNDVRRVYNFVAVLRFPGCVEYVNDQGPGVGGDFRTTSIVQAPIYDLDYEGSKRHCSVQIRADELDPGEIITAEFVVSQEYDRCDILLGYNPDRQLYSTYYWDTNNVKFVEVRRESVTPKGALYERAGETPHNSAFIGAAEKNGLIFRTFVHGFESRRVAALDCTIPPELGNVTFTAEG